MRNAGRWTVVVVIIAALGIWALQSGGSAAGTPKEKPATVEHIEGSEISKVTLTERASQRLDIQTADVTEQQIDGGTKTVVAYGAVFYDSMGNAWTYTNPEPLVFVRAPLTIERIEGDMAILADGPAAGTKIVSVGAALLYGTEFGVGH